MITIEEKMNLFSKQIFEKVQEENNEKVKEVEQHNQRVMKEHKEKIIQEKRAYVEKKIKDLEKKNRQFISKTIGQINKDIILKKNEMLQNLLYEIKEALIQFTHGEGYKDFLLENIKRSIQGLDKAHPIEIQMTQKDVAHFQKNIEAYLIKEGWMEEKLRITPIGEDIIGGVMILDTQRGVRLDTTLSTKIEENKSYIGEILYKELQKEGEAHD